MSTARIFDFADYREDPITTEVPVVSALVVQDASELVRPTPVLEAAQAKVGELGEWASEQIRRGGAAWWDIAKCSPSGAAFVGQRIKPILMDVEGKAAINTHTRTIKNRKLAAKTREEGSDEQLQAINAEKRARADRKRARVAHGVRVAGVNGGAVATGLVGLHCIPDVPLALDVLVATAGSCTGVTALGLLGRRVKGGDALIGKARARSINDQLLREVMSNLGIQALTQKISEVKPVTLTVDNKTHFSTTLRLPMRVTASEVQTRHEIFAGNLDVNPDCLILERGESASRLVVKVSKIDPARRKQGTWEPPKVVDIFGDLVLGENAIGEQVSTDIESGLLAIGESGSGKSMALQLLIATAVLDPLVHLRLGAFAASGDFAHLLPIAEQSIIADATDQEIARQGARMIEDLNKECALRGDILLQLDEPKVTRALAERHPELRPIVCIFDEIQVLLAQGEIGRKAKADLLTLLSKCRKAGIRPIVATPRIDKGVIDTSFVGAFTRKLVFKTAKEWEGRELLGGTSEAEGFKPFTFKRKGEAVIRDEAGRSKLRVYPLGNKQQRSSIERALAMRGGAVTKLDIAQDTTWVNSVPESAEPQVTACLEETLLRDILAVSKATPEQIAENPAREHAVHLDDLTDLLRESAGDYKTLGDDEVRKRLFAVGVKTDQANKRVPRSERWPNGQSWVRGIKFRHVRCALLEEQCEKGSNCTHRGSEK